MDGWTNEEGWMEKDGWRGMDGEGWMDESRDGKLTMGIALFFKI